MEFLNDGGMIDYGHFCNSTKSMDLKEDFVNFGHFKNDHFFDRFSWCLEEKIENL